MNQTQNFTMKDLPDSERPYEKCMAEGASALSDAELLAVLIKTGTREKTSLAVAMELLRLHPSYSGLIGLYHLKMKDLMRIKGIGQVKAVQILCAVELARRLSRQTKGECVILDAPHKVAAYFMEYMRHLETEHFYAAYMDASSRLLHSECVFTGTIRSADASPREILRQALAYDAAQFVVLHNHPSGDPSPSRADIATTEHLSQAGKLVGVPMVDHVIIGDNQYVSMKERGYLD